MGNGLNEFNQLRRIVKEGASILGAIEEEEHRKKEELLKKEGRQIEEDATRIKENENAYKRGLNAAKIGEERFQLKEMDCPNCGAQMKPSDFSNKTAVLGSVDCPYCGSKIVLNDEVKNAEYVHKVDVEKKRTEIEDRKVKLQEDKLKAQKEHEDNKNTLDTIKSIDNGIDKAVKLGRTAMGCFTVGIIFIILIVVLIVFLINR